MITMADSLMKIFGMKRIDPGCKTCSHARVFETRRGACVYCHSTNQTHDVKQSDACKDYVLRLERDALVKRHKQVQEGRQS